MASFLNANFDSEDEEDDDYAPTVAENKQALRDEGIRPPPKPKPGSKRGRVPPSSSTGAEQEAEAAEGEEGSDDADSDDAGEDEDAAQPKLMLPKPGQAAAKRAKIEAVWLALNSRETGGANAIRPPSSSINLAALCGRAKALKNPSPELKWQTQLGITAPQRQLGVFSRPAGEANGKHAAANGADGVAAQEMTHASGQPPAGADAAATGEQGTSGAESGLQTTISESARAAAAAALAAAKEAASLGVSRSYNKVTVTETRRFAGQDIQVTVQVDKDSKAAAKQAQEAQKAVAAPSGLDRFLAEIEKKKKVNILDKSKMDWNQLKSKDAQMDEELETHKRSNKKYLDKVEFLKKAELREYEIERDKRLAGDVRLRNRL